MNDIKRRLCVCVKKRCSECAIGRDLVPDGCEYALCHVMEREGGVMVAPRRSGKTTKILTMARDMCSSGYSVVVLTMNHEMAGMLQRRMMGTGVHILSAKSDMQKALGKLPVSAVFSDEVDGDIAKRVEEFGHQFVLGYRS